MTVSGQSSSFDQAALVACALLRLGSDTKAARVFREIVVPTLLPDETVAGAALVRLVDALEIPAHERQRRMAEARQQAVAAVARTQTAGLG